MTHAPADDDEAQRLLTVLRDGTEGEQFVARLGLAAIFERRGLLEDAAACYLTNLERGDRSPLTCDRLASVYRRLAGEGAGRAHRIEPPPRDERDGSTPAARSARDDPAPSTISAASLTPGEWAVLLIVGIACRVVLDLATAYAIVVAGFMMTALALLTIAFVERRRDEQAVPDDDDATGGRASLPRVATLQAVAQTSILIPFAAEVGVYLLKRSIDWLGPPL